MKINEIKKHFVDPTLDELSKDIQKLYDRVLNKNPNLELIIYGYEEMMVSKFKLLEMYKKNSNNFYLKDRYNKLYKAVVNVKVDYVRVDNETKKSFIVEGEYDFSVDDGTTITESKRYDAIVNASSKAVDEILSRIAVASFR